MRITLISHASVLIEAGSVAILTDPWLMGVAFNESWALLSEPALKPDALSAVTHIWISHEHPDHLDFLTLKAIPPQDKAKITLLYQRHFSCRVARALEKLGFREVRELPLTRWVEIGDEVSLMCCSVGSIDSLLAVKSRDATVLNVNDCIVSKSAAPAIAKRVGAVDVLLTQFSFANWVGNPDATDIIAPRQKLMEMRDYVAYFHPKVTIPFASFVYFCHQENRFMNRWSNRPDQVCKALRDAPTELQFLYSGDSWSSDAGFQLNGDPIERYRADYAKIPERSYLSHPTYNSESLIDLGQSLADRVRSHFPWFVLRSAAPIYFYVYDLGVAVCFDLRSGNVEVSNRRRGECDIEVGSQALWYAFKFPWGFGTLEISGRYKLINHKMNKFGLYLCHIYSSAFDSNGAWTALIARRSLSFWWSKRGEIFERLVRSLARRFRKSPPPATRVAELN